MIAFSSSNIFPLAVYLTTAASDHVWQMSDLHTDYQKTHGDHFWQMLVLHAGCISHD